MIHADLWGPAPIIFSIAFKFYLVFVDEYTKFTWVYLLKHKSNIFQVFSQFYAMIYTQFSLPIQVLRTDYGGEFTSTKFNQFMPIKALFTKFLVVIHHNRMVLQKESIDTSFNVL